MRGEHSGTDAHRDDAVRRGVQTRRHDSGDGTRLLMKTDRDGGIPPRVLEPIAAVTGKDEPHAQLRRRLAKRPDLISNRCGNEQDTFAVKRSALHVSYLRPLKLRRTLA